MSDTYTFNQCYDLLHVDAKTFRTWLKEAGIDPDHQVSRADRRIRFLTHAQLEHLAQEHGRLLGRMPLQSEPSVAPASFKLLVDRVTSAEEELARVPLRLAEATHELTEQLQHVHKEMTAQHEELQSVFIQQQRQIEDLTKQLQQAHSLLTEQQRHIEMLTERLGQLHEEYTVQQHAIGEQLVQAQQHLQAIEVTMREQQSETVQQVQEMKRAFLTSFEGVEHNVSLLQQQQEHLQAQQQGHEQQTTQSMTKLVNRVNLSEVATRRLKTTTEAMQATLSDSQRHTQEQDRSMQVLLQQLQEERYKREQQMLILSSQQETNAASKKPTKNPKVSE